MATCAMIAALSAPQAREVRVPLALGVAVARVESGCNPKATGAHGEVGIFQILPMHLRDIALRTRCGVNLRDTTTNVCFGIRLLRRSFVRAHGNWRVALTRYFNGGGDGNYWLKIRHALKRGYR